MTEEEQKIKEAQVDVANLQIAAVRELCKTLREVTAQTIAHEVEKQEEQDARTQVADEFNRIQEMERGRESTLNLLMVCATEIYAHREAHDERDAVDAATKILIRVRRVVADLEYDGQE